MLLALSPLKNSGVAPLSLPFGGFGGFAAPAAAPAGGPPPGGPGGGASGGCPPGACAIGDACEELLLSDPLSGLFLAANELLLIVSNGSGEFCRVICRLWTADTSSGWSTSCAIGSGSGVIDRCSRGGAAE